MDVDSFKDAFDLGGKALSLLKQAKDLMPSGPEKDAATETIIEAEKAFHIAEAKAAQELGYQLCKCTWPPQIMTLSESGQPLCPVCGRSGAIEEITITETDAPLEQEEKGTVSEAEAEILKCLAALGDRGISASVVARNLDMSRPKAEYYIDIMIDKELIYGSYAMGQDPEYSLDQKGREFLVKNDLI